MRTCIQTPSRSTWAEVANQGRVAHDRLRGWHLDFHSVEWPGGKKRWVIIRQAPGYGRFSSRKETKRCHKHILAQTLERDLCNVLAIYMNRDTPENSSLHRWQHDFLPYQRQAHERRGRPSAKRGRELERYEPRGHLEFWREMGLHSVDKAALELWKPRRPGKRGPSRDPPRESSARFAHPWPGPLYHGAPVPWIGG